MRIGLVLNVLNEEYQISVLDGVKEEASRLGLELVCFQLEGVPFSIKTFANQFPASKFFGLDGIILITPSVTDSHLLKSKDQLQELWPGLPVVSLGQGIFDVPSILIQTNTSMKILVEHLIRVHKYQNFLFIQGPDLHYDASERKYIFEQTLDMYKSFVPTLRYSEKKGNFIEIDGTTAIAEYYQENKSLPDAVVCANDNMAIGVYKFLQTHSDKIKPCAVTGFDDVPRSEYVVPALSTVHQPLKESGLKSVELINKVLKNQTVNMETYVDSSVVIRESCGCCRENVQELYTDKKIEELQRNYTQTERFLIILSYLGQELIFCDSNEDLRKSLDNYFKQLEVSEFYVFAFTDYIHPDNLINADNLDVIPIYLKKNNEYLSYLYKHKKYKLNEVQEKLVKNNGFSMNNKIIKYLNNGDKLIGFVIYEDISDRLQFLCSVCNTLSQTLFRIKNIEQEKKRAEYLEREVTKRTAELINANNQRMKVEAEVLKISEIERHRFSLDLHDDICQRLAGISMLCRSYSRNDGGIEKEQMVELAELINDTLQRTRQYAHNSYPVELESLGLNGSLNNLCNSFSHQNSIECEYNWEIGDEIHFDNLHKLNIFRIIQESLHNISKHASAKHIKVVLKNDENKIHVTITDDGKGFAQKSLENKGIGLTSMEYRANQIGAELKAENCETGGAKIEFSFENPVQKD